MIFRLCFPSWHGRPAAARVALSRSLTLRDFVAPGLRVAVGGTGRGMCHRETTSIARDRAGSRRHTGTGTYDAPASCRSCNASDRARGGDRQRPRANTSVRSPPATPLLFVCPCTCCASHAARSLLPAASTQHLRAETPPRCRAHLPNCALGVRKSGWGGARGTATTEISRRPR